jgi:TipAS antibiotic-recognition domain
MNRLLAHGRTRTDEWPALIADVRAAMERGVAPDSDEAQGLSNRWRELMMRSVAGDTSLAIKMKLAYFDQPDVRARIQTRSGLDAAVTEYLMDIWRHQHLALWTRHLGYDDARRLHLPDDRMREWLRVVAEMRDALKAGHAPDSDGVQRLLCESEMLLDEFSSGDLELKRRMLDAFSVDRDLQSGWALDAELLTFVARARETAPIPGARIG